MIHAFVGIIRVRGSNQCMRGNGKTLSMTGYLYLKHLKGSPVYTNYYTDFSDKIDSCQNIINYLHDEKPENVSCGFTEMQNVINSLGSGAKKVLFINKFASQIRKIDAEALYDTQRLYDINNRLREHTDVIWIPEKRHIEDGSLCNNDRCKKDHDVYVWRYEPYSDRWIRKFNCKIIGSHYDSKQIVEDYLDKNPEGEKNGD